MSNLGPGLHTIPDCFSHRIGLVEFALFSLQLHETEWTCTAMSRSIVFDSCEAQLEWDHIGLVQLQEMECGAPGGFT